MFLNLITSFINHFSFNAKYAVDHNSYSASVGLMLQLQKFEMIFHLSVASMLQVAVGTLLVSKGSQ